MLPRMSDATDEVRAVTLRLPGSLHKQCKAISRQASDRLQRESADEDVQVSLRAVYQLAVTMFLTCYDRHPEDVYRHLKEMA